MLEPSQLFRGAIGPKLNRAKRVVGGYADDRKQRAIDKVTSHLVAYALFAAAGVFLIAACLVGLTALFRWVEIKYGLFYAFAVIGGLPLLIAIGSTAFAVVCLRRQPKPIVPLASRLRVALKTSPTELAAAALTGTAMAEPTHNRRRSPSKTSRTMPGGLAMAAMLTLGAIAGTYARRSNDDINEA
jgi:hypothetical protein